MGAKPLISLADLEALDSESRMQALIERTVWDPNELTPAQRTWSDQADAEVLARLRERDRTPKIA